MFTGIIESTGVIRKTLSRGQGRILAIEAGMALEGTRIGDSIAVNGACLTVVKYGRKSFEVDMSPETVERTSFKHLGPGAAVNIERALRIYDRLDGHLVSGHIDGTGTVTAIKKKSNALVVTISMSPFPTDEIIEKGSVAIDGISLTINKCSDHDFEISVIPHTAGITTISMLKPGDVVNIETDMIGKYVKRVMQTHLADKNNEGAPQSRVSMELLAKKGFL